MKKYWLILLGALMSLQATGQSTDATIEKQEAACYARFAVNDCLRKVRAQQREARDLQRRKEIELNDIDRKEKAQKRIEQLNENLPNPG